MPRLSETELHELRTLACERCQKALHSVLQLAEDGRDQFIIASDVAAGATLAAAGALINALLEDQNAVTHPEFIVDTVFQRIKPAILHELKPQIDFFEAGIAAKKRAV